MEVTHNLSLSLCFCSVRVEFKCEYGQTFSFFAADKQILVGLQNKTIAHVIIMVT